MIIEEWEKAIGYQYVSGQSWQAIQEWPETYYVGIIDMFLQRVLIMILKKEGEKVIGYQYVSGKSCQAILYSLARLT